MNTPITDDSAASPNRTPLSRVVLVFAFSLGLWTLCTGIDPESWVVGLPACVLFTATVMLNRNRAHPLHFRALPGFLLYFVLQSFRTGMDVARRALHPVREIHPGFCNYPARLPRGTPQAVFANMITLLPGTLSWCIEDDVHKVHLLSGHPLILEDLAKLESRVGRLFGLDLPEDLL
jgi:multisubunit Na+/H+ antiporter MnhE subunit